MPHHLTAGRLILVINNISVFPFALEFEFEF